MFFLQLHRVLNSVRVSFQKELTRELGRELAVWLLKL
jgi:hypothetical protein